VQFVPESKLKEIRDSIPSKVWEQVRIFRKQQNLSQTELADRVGMDRQYIYKIEKGKMALLIKYT